MIVADKLRRTNRAEYLLYMWQVEDLLRSFHFDVDHLTEHYLSHFQVPSEVREEMQRWYEDIARMMREEGVSERGHIQILRNALSDLEDFHRRLLASPKFPYYREMYYRVLPFIVELRAKDGSSSADTQSPPLGGRKGGSELETCFNALYGTLMLRLQQQQISPETQRAMQEISNFLGQLSDYYLKDKDEPLEL